MQIRGTKTRKERGDTTWRRERIEQVPARALEGDTINVSKATFKETRAQNFPNLMKATNPHIQEVQKFTSIDKKKSTQIHYKQTIECQYKEEILKIAVLKRNSN